MMDAVLAISARGLKKRYRRGLFRKSFHDALVDLNLEVPLGAAFGLIGPNGAGKTTFIKTLLGVVRPSAGEVSVLGGHPEDPKVRARLGYLPERLYLPESWSPRAFLRSVAQLKGVKAAPIDALLGRVGLAADRDREIGGFSKGMKQRVGLAAALLGDPALLILDEPTDGVDPLGRAEIRDLLVDLVKKGTTLFLNSHLLSETERICGEIAILNRGRVAMRGQVQSLGLDAPGYRLRFAPGAHPDALAAAGLEAMEDGTFRTAALSPEALDATLGAARASGALLTELTREKKDLEELLRATVEGP